MSGLRLPARFTRDLKQDAQAGLVLGVQSVPDGLATGILAGLSPLNGLYGYLVGTLVGAAVTSSAFMVVQGTGAMAMIIADVPALHAMDDQSQAVATLAVLTGAVMLAAGFLKLGSLLRFVSNAVLVGFMNAVGVNIILGQLSNLTGYAAPGANRVIRAINTVLSPASLDWRSVIIGAATIALIVLLERTVVGSMGLVVAVIATSAMAAVLGWTTVATLNDLGVELQGLPPITLPAWDLAPQLLVPAASLAFVGLVQGAGISAMYGRPDGQRADASRDFIGQGAANAAVAFTGGMPVGGSASASAINAAAGARSRVAPMIAALVMAVVVLVFGSAVGYLAMPALAGLLILVGFRTIKPADIKAVWRTGTVQRAVLGVTFVLTMVVPLQYAVLVGVGVSVVLHVVQQSNKVVIKQRVSTDTGDVLEVDPVAVVPPRETVVLQPYGSLFFASAPVFEAALPRVEASSRRSVVILRLRGHTDLGTTFVDVLVRYAGELDAVGSRLMIVSVDARVMPQLRAGGVIDVIGPDSVFEGDARVGAALARARTEAQDWIARDPA
ncbi:SulP family inorganic anion transporter [Longivirga aurantiaca]|uniref:SulP family inorganic anion transporter n=1 Tax=Longivirga aurantiaca TaxID=1837743 RepID=A0ABW1SVN9_9ACTN